MLPTNPVLLMSYINTQLRDNYADLDALCDDLDVEKKQIIFNLENIGYEYMKDSNQFKLK